MTDSTIFRQIFSSRRKCCPSDFFNVYMRGKDRLLRVVRALREKALLLGPQNKRMRNQPNRPVIGISVGYVNGIGTELILKTFSDHRLLELCTPVIFGSNK